METRKLSPASSLADQQIQSPALLNQALSDAITFSKTVAALDATQTYSTVDASATIQGNGGVNVIDFTGGEGINLDKKEALTLSGGANDIFYINFFDGAGFSLSGAAQILLAGGVNPHNIYWNIVDGTEITLDRATAYGTILNITPSNVNQGNAGDFTMKNATLYGRIIGGAGAETTLQNSTITEVAEIEQVPEANSLAMLAALGGLTLFPSLSRRWGKGALLSWA